jgi:hypothetical protein
MNDRHLKKIIDKQFKIANLKVKFEDICKDQQLEIFNKYSYTEEENKKWKEWAINYMRDKMKLTKDKAYIQTEWLNLNYGLRVADSNKNKSVKNTVKKKAKKKK